MNARAKIMSTLRGSLPLRAGQIAERVYGEDSPRTRNLVVVHICHMNRQCKVIVSNGRGGAAKGYSVAKVRVSLELEFQMMAGLVL